MLLLKNLTVYNAVTPEPFAADILIDGSKIVSIAPGITAEAEVIDCTGKRAYPGFIEAHGHIGLDGYGIGFEGADYN